MSNSAGPLTVNAAEEMAAYDVLPTPVKRALQRATVVISAQAVARRMQRGQSAMQAAAELERYDERLRSVLAFAVYGPEHPEALPYVPADLLRQYGCMEHYLVRRAQEPQPAKRGRR